MADEKIVILNLRKQVVGTARWMRNEKSVRLVRKILQKQAKGKRLKIGKELNEKIWGSPRIPQKMRVKITKIDEKTFEANLEK